MTKRLILTVLGAFFHFASVRADQTMMRFEGDSFPHNANPPWQVFDSCQSPCSESLGTGVFRLLWTQAADIVNYSFTIAQTPNPPPPSLWVEWRFRSNHPIGPNFFTCDGEFSTKYGGIVQTVEMYGDAAFSNDGNHSISLPFSQFHSYRFESLDGINFRISGNGVVFISDSQNSPNGLHRLQLRGRGGCGGDQIPNMVNEWDFVRYGTIGTGEQVMSTVPVSGALGPGAYTNFTNFLVTFDQPNYVYIDDITVSVTGGIAPIVTATRRTDTHDEKTVEIVLDRALPPNELTTFTLNDGQQTTDIHYDFRANPSAIPTSGTSGLVTFTVALVVVGYLILRGRQVSRI